MKPFVDPAFWSDPEIEAASSEVKLTMLWLISNSQTSVIGVCGASKARFSFETGLDATLLQKTIKALPRALKGFEGLVYIRNYARHQFGAGEKMRKNNFFIALKSAFAAIKIPELREAILEDYPEFIDEHSKGFEGLIKPKDGKVRKGKVRKEGGAGGEALEVYEAYPVKVGKPKALIAIQRAISNHGAEHVLSKTKEFAAARNGDKEFCPHPATWFNQERYNDNPDTWVHQKTTKSEPDADSYANQL